MYGESVMHYKEENFTKQNIPDQRSVLVSSRTNSGDIPHFWQEPIISESFISESALGWLLSFTQEDETPGSIA